MKTILFTLLGLALLFIAPPAQATTISECQAVIGVLITDTQAATLSAKDESALLGKAQNASLKLDQAKFADALQKLVDYQNTLNALHGAAKPKISAADYATLSADVAAAIACVQDLINSL
jgi:hypothetical protein